MLEQRPEVRGEVVKYVIIVICLLIFLAVLH